jgi:hypothetical protein
MKLNKKNYPVRAAALLMSMLCVASVPGAVEEGASEDKTGTNPINFSPEFRIYNEFSELNTADDAQQNVTTLEGRAPLLDGKVQLRVRARYSYLDLDSGSESGAGDTDFRLLTVPYLNKQKALAAAVGMEVFLDTASEDVLGSGNTSLGPQIFFVKFFPNGLFAPAVQYKFSVDEDSGRSETDQVLIDLNYLRMAADKQSWFFADPQIIIDNENNEEFMIVDLEFGAMMSKWTGGLAGQSVYLRPSFGIGNDRPVDGSVEVGYKFIF